MRSKLSTPPWARPLVVPLLLVLGLGPGLAIGQPSIPTDSGPIDPPAAESSDATLAQAKVAEEGDRDLDTALAGYDTVVKNFDAQRRSAAEAMFRSGEIALRQGNGHRARMLQQRLLQEFRDFKDLSQAAQAWFPTMAPQQFQMSPELMRRYGLMPSPPVTVTPETAPGAATQEDPNLSRFQPVTPAGSPVSPRARNPDIVDLPLLGGKPPGAGLAPLPAEISARLMQQRELQSNLTQLRAEILSTSGQLRRARRERRLLDAEDPSLIPTSLLGDSKLSKAIAEVDELALAVSQVSGAEREQATKSLKVRQMLLREQVEQTRRRAEAEVRALEAELSLLREEADGVELDWRRVSAEGEQDWKKLEAKKSP